MRIRDRSNPGLGLGSGPTSSIPAGEADELSELLAEAAVKAEARAAPGALALSSYAAVLQHADNEGMETIARPLLTLVCPVCGATFPSAMQMDPRTFEGIQVTNLFERCPKCSRVSRFNKPDYLFRAPGEAEINLRSGRARRTAAPKAN